MTVSCGSCKTKATVELTTRMVVRLVPPWRARNAWIGSDQAGAVVFLCSEFCEVIYGERVGYFVDGVRSIK